MTGASYRRGRTTYVNGGLTERVIKTGAEIPFTRYFYKYEAPEPSDKLLAEFNELEAQLQAQLKELMA